MIEIEEPLPLHCGRCYDEVTQVFEANCAEKPEDQTSALGMYHCPDCGMMLVAGIPHFKMCQACLDRKHPLFDKEGL